ncbi:MAG: PGPGW domain-containing protein [Thermoguttaceae bacterium]
MLEWLQSHEILLGWLGAVSVLMFVGSLILVPWLVIRIPPDYFVHRRRWLDRHSGRHPLVRVLLLAAKNLLGVILVLAGVAMLVLPGQGILTILIGLMCIDFPGKFALEKRLANQPPILAAMNWIRTKAGRETLAVTSSRRDHSSP